MRQGPVRNASAPRPVASTLRWQRWILTAILLGSAVIVLPPTVENFMLGKATLVVAGAVLLVALGAARSVSTRVVHLPVSAAVVAVGVFGVALCLATLVSPTPLASVIGSYTRYTGLVPYLAYLAVFFVALRVTDAATSRLLMRSTLLALGLVVAYGLLQALGIEPLGFEDNGLGTVFSFFGNVDFSAAWVGAVCAVALVTALSSHEQRAWRAAAVVLLPLAVVYLVLTGTSQGLAVATISLGWAVLVLATAPGGRARELARTQSRRLVGAGVVAVALVVAAVVALLPLLRAQLDQALVERPEFWVAAWRMFADHPVLGTGLDTYGQNFLAYRPVSHALLNPGGTADAPHSVPLGMFSNGGLVLGLAYAAVVVLVGLALLRAVATARGEGRLALGAFGGVWLGYQAQSLISFDVPPLAVLHWLSAGVILAMVSPPRWREVHLPGFVAAGAPRGKRSPAAPRASAAPRPVLLGLAALTAVALWVVAYPLRADLAAASAAPLYNRQGLPQAIDLLEKAARLNPSEPTYPFLIARGEETAERYDRALAAAAVAAGRAPGASRYATFAATQAQQLGDRATAARWAREAVERDPHNPQVLAAAANDIALDGNLPEAEALLERSLDLRTDPATLVLLGKVRAATGDLPGARAAFEQALAAAPDDPAASAALEELALRE